MIDSLSLSASRSPAAEDAATEDAASGAAAVSAVSYGLDELLALAGEQLGEEITPRTVRLYATQGLIDRPGREGRSAVYGRRHLLQLLLIRSLARRGLSLAAIAPLCGLADHELAQQLAQLEAPSEPVALPLPASSPLASPPVAPPVSPRVSSLPASAQEDQPNEALAFLQQLRQDVGARDAATAPEADACISPSLDSPSLDSRSLLPLLGSPLTPRSSPSSRAPSRNPSRSPGRPAPRSGGSREAASRWHRFTLAPGVELQISESVSVPPPGSRRMAWLNRLVARLLEQLEDSPP